ncbi:MAG: hypothetical protein NVSMB64_22780 [Candidatus Velthaea sp.]
MHERGNVDRGALQRDFERIMDVFYRKQLGRLGVGSLLNDVMSTVGSFPFDELGSHHASSRWVSYPAVR